MTKPSPFMVRRLGRISRAEHLPPEVGGVGQEGLLVRPRPRKVAEHVLLLRELGVEDAVRQQTPPFRVTSRLV